MKTRSLRNLPSVDRVLTRLEPQTLPRPVVVDLVRQTLREARVAEKVPSENEIVEQARLAVAGHLARKIRPVINGTGVLIHTNLGRVPLAEPAAQAAAVAGFDYNNLEIDLESGGRGQRGAYVERHLAVACGAEAATVVNNCAAALVLSVRRWIRGERREALVSRGESIQIGGGFRIPEMLEASGAVLRDVGTTNKTTVADFSKAIGKRTALILRVHRSNFFMSGFVASPSTKELALLARKRRIPFVEDLGSGAMMNTEAHALQEHEPRPAELIADGAGTVCFSGDKLFGGPQAGIIAGRRSVIASIKKDPMFRAFRCDKLVLAALQETVDLHLRSVDTQTGSGALPIVQMLEASEASLRIRAERLAQSIGSAGGSLVIANASSQVGGGTMPRSSLRSIALQIRPDPWSLEAFAKRLRLGPTPVVGYISGRSFWIDLRTVFPRQDHALAEALRAAFQPDSAA